jgi:hypothetical protein
LTHLSIGKEADHIEESEFIGEEAGLLEYPLAARDHAELAAFIAETKKLRKITDRALLGRAGCPPTPCRICAKACQYRTNRCSNWFGWWSNCAMKPSPSRRLGHISGEC